MRLRGAQQLEIRRGRAGPNRAGEAKLRRGGASKSNSGEAGAAVGRPGFLLPARALSPSARRMGRRKGQVVALRASCRRETGNPTFAGQALHAPLS
jgi:hypothetical protein